QAFTGKVCHQIQEIEHNRQLIYFHNYYFFDPEMNAVISFAINITQEKLASDQLRAEQEFSQNLLDNTTDGILAFDNEGCFTAWNLAMEKSTKMLRKNVINKCIFNLFPQFKKTELE